jgi:hypothetical protein
VVFIHPHAQQLFLQTCHLCSHIHRAHPDLHVVNGADKLITVSH